MLPGDNLGRKLTLLFCLGALLVGGACPWVPRATSPQSSAPAAVHVPPGGARFVVEIPEGLRSTEDQAQDLLGRCYRALQSVYCVHPGYPWRVVYHDESAPPYPDLLAPPSYRGDGLLYLSQAYLQPPNDDPRWKYSAILGTLEGMAYGFNHFFGLQNTDVDMGLATLIARQRAPTLWIDQRTTQIDALIVSFQEQEEQSMQAQRDRGAWPAGVDDRIFARQRQICLCTEINNLGYSEMWARLFRDMRQRDLPLTKVTNHQQGNQVLIESLKRVSGHDFTPLFAKYGY